MGALETAYDDSKKEGFESHAKKHDRAQKLVDQGKRERAVVLFRENLAWSLNNLGENHEATVYDQETLAFTLNELKQYEEAKNLDKKALETRLRIEGLSPPSEYFLETQRNLANDYFGLGNITQAAAIYEKNYDHRRQHPGLGEDDEDTLKVGHDLASCWYKLRDFKKAQELHQKILAARTRINAPEIDIIQSRLALALDQFGLGWFNRAKKLSEKNVEALKSTASDPILLAASEKALARCIDALEEKKQRERAEKEAQEKVVEEKKQRERAEKEAQEKALEEKIQRERTEKEAQEKKQRERAEREAQEKALEEKKQRERAEAEKEAQEKAVGEKKQREHTGKGVQEKAEKAAQEKLTTAASQPLPIPRLNPPSHHPKAQSLPKSGGSAVGLHDGHSHEGGSNLSRKLRSRSDSDTAPPPSEERVFPGVRHVKAKYVDFQALVPSKLFLQCIHSSVTIGDRTKVEDGKQNSPPPDREFLKSNRRLEQPAAPRKSLKIDPPPESGPKEIRSGRPKTAGDGQTDAGNKNDKTLEPTSTTPAAQSSPDITRAQSLSRHRDKPSTSPHPRPVSLSRATSNRMSQSLLSFIAGLTLIFKSD
jgi:hypothetical protein